MSEQHLQQLQKKVSLDFYMQNRYRMGLPLAATMFADRTAIGFSLS